MGAQTQLQTEQDVPTMDIGTEHGSGTTDTHSSSEGQVAGLVQEPKSEQLVEVEQLVAADIRRPVFIAGERTTVHIIEQFLCAVDLAKPAGEQSAHQFIIQEDGAVRLSLPPEVEEKKKELFNLEVVQIGEEIGRKLNETYWFDKLNTTQKNNYNKNKQNRRLAESAFETAATLIQLLSEVHPLYTQGMYLLESSMKSALHKMRRNVSHKDLWEMIELLRMFGYLTEDSATVGLPKQKVKYHIALLPDEQLVHLTAQLDGYNKAIANSKLGIKEVQTKIKSLKAKIKRNAKPKSTDAGNTGGDVNDAEQSDSGDTTVEGVSTADEHQNAASGTLQGTTD